MGVEVDGNGGRWAPWNARTPATMLCMDAGADLEAVDSYKYLGVALDNRLSLKDHLAELSERCRRKFFSFCGWARREHLHNQPRQQPCRD